MLPALLVGSHTQVLAVARALGSVGVPVVTLRYHDRDFACGSRWVREVIDCPHPGKQPSQFLAVLEGLAGRFAGSLVVPPTDAAVMTVSQHKDALTQWGYMVGSPDHDVVRACVDKSATYAFAQAHEVAVPAFRRVNSVDDLEQFAKEVPFPAVLRPTVSHRFYGAFKRKWTRVNNLDHAVECYRQGHSAGFDMVIQEMIPGDELCGANYNAYVWEDGRVEMTAAKIRNSPPLNGSPSATVSRDIPDVAEAGYRMLSALGYRGYANIEFKRDPRDGIWKLLEINARHNLSGMLALECGINFPELEYRHRIFGETPQQMPYKKGIYWIDITRDVRASIAYLRRKDYSVWRFARPYLSRRVFAVASLRDPLPAIMRMRETLSRLARKPIQRLVNRFGDATARTRVRTDTHRTRSVPRR